MFKSTIFSWFPALPFVLSQFSSGSFPLPPVWPVWFDRINEPVCAGAFSSSLVWTQNLLHHFFLFFFFWSLYFFSFLLSSTYSFSHSAFISATWFWLSQKISFEGYLSSVLITLPPSPDKLAFSCPIRLLNLVFDSSYSQLMPYFSYTF